MFDQDWARKFDELYHQAMQRYSEGRTTPTTLLEPTEVQFLQGIGCSAQELFDFVEDASLADGPEFHEVLLVTALRREYFLTVQMGQPSGKVVDPSELPAKTAEVDGIRWLPRLIAKARAKLRGELHSNTMYGCGGDRPFLRSVHTSLSDFLRVVRDAGESDQQIIDFIKQQSRAS